MVNYWRKVQHIFIEELYEMRKGQEISKGNCGVFNSPKIYIFQIYQFSIKKFIFFLCLSGIMNGTQLI